MAIELDEEVEEPLVVLPPELFISPTPAFGQMGGKCKNGGQTLKEMIYIVCKV